MSVKKLLKGISEYETDFLESKPDSLKIVCHRGPDGIIGASLLIKYCLKNEIDFVVSTLKILDYESILQLAIEKYDQYIFVGFGTESLKNIEEVLKKKKVLIFDHHTPNTTKSSKNVICPSFFGIKSYKEVFTSGLVYLFCISNDKSFEKLAWLPSISVYSEYANGEISELNRSIVQTAMNNNDIAIIRSLKSLSLQNFPIHKALSSSIEPYIPGISANTEEAVEFLNNTGISIRKEGGQGYRILAELQEEEARRLASSLIIERLGSSKDQEDVFGEVNVFTDPKFPVADLKGFALLLKACSYLNKPSTAIGLCLKEVDVQEDALAVFDEYVREIISALDWFYKEKKAEKSSGENFVFFNAESKIKENTLSSVVSLIARSNVYRPGFIIVGCCHTIDEKLKISSRIVGEEKNVNLLDILQDMIKKVGDGSSGGHKNAAGATISLKHEKIFTEIACDILKKKAVEESIV